MEKKIAHLEMIQGVINRTGRNSFSLKGWSVILVSALFALSANDSDERFIYLAYFPALAFWVLDGFFLHQERLYRELYDKVRTIDESDIDFDMNASIFKNKVDSWLKVVFSKTLRIFHGAVLGTITVVMLWT